VVVDVVDVDVVVLGDVVAVDARVTEDCTPAGTPTDTDAAEGSGVALQELARHATTASERSRLRSFCDLEPRSRRDFGFRKASVIAIRLVTASRTVTTGAGSRQRRSEVEDEVYPRLRAAHERISIAGLVDGFG
jgi:hypothetical protein